MGTSGDAPREQASPLRPGVSLGSYEIVAAIGAGGMGEVWRARDSELHREVAIKLLPSALTGDADAMRRFSREARLLAALNQPNIATIHSVGESDGARFIVMELLQGETLAERVDRGAVPVEEALEIARQIAEGLDAAHEAGIIHRDLKPGNIMLTGRGDIKILDFGLAKPVQAKAAVQDTEATTAAENLTSTGAVPGTAPYTSPEQLRGETFDKRVDIWAFGCVLFELLAGRAAFARGSGQETVACILRDEPAWQQLPDTVPDSVLGLLRRCLRKNPRDRLRDIGDARIEIVALLRKEAPGAAPAPSRGDERTSPRAGRVAVIAAVGLVAALAGWYFGGMFRESPDPRRPHYLEMSLADSYPIDARVAAMPVMALSPDGSRLVYVAQTPSGTQLAMREMDSEEIRLLPDTEGASQPFFSADGLWVGYFAYGNLEKVAVGGGAAISLAQVANPWGAAWTDRGIVFTPSDSTGLWLVSDQGGDATPLTSLDRDRGEFSHDFPFPLPDGRGVLFTIVSMEGAFGVALYDFETRSVTRLFEGGGFGQFLAPRYILYGDGDKLLTRPFDVRSGQVTGPPTVVVTDVLPDGGGALPRFALSSSGALVFVPGAEDEVHRNLAWVDRAGDVETLSAELRDYTRAGLSPDGTRVAVVGQQRNADVLRVFEIGGGAVSERILESSAGAPIWSPDGEWIAFSTVVSPTREGAMALRLVRARADGSGPVQEFAGIEGDGIEGLLLTSWSRDGRFLALRVSQPATGHDIFVIEAQPPHRVVTTIASRAKEEDGVLSPDGTLIAYTSNETRMNRVYVREVAGSGRLLATFGTGASEPLWGPHGDELFYLQGGELVAVELRFEPGFSPGPPRTLFEGAHRVADGAYDVHHDGSRFLMVQEGTAVSSPTRLKVWLDWRPETVIAR